MLDRASIVDAYWTITERRQTSLSSINSSILSPGLIKMHLHTIPTRFWIHLLFITEGKGYRESINFIWSPDKMLQNVASRKRFFIFFHSRLKPGDLVFLFNYEASQSSKYLNYFKVINKFYPLMSLCCTFRSNFPWRNNNFCLALYRANKLTLTCLHGVYIWIFDGLLKVSASFRINKFRTVKN